MGFHLKKDGHIRFRAAAEVFVTSASVYTQCDRRVVEKEFEELILKLILKGVKRTKA